MVPLLDGFIRREAKMAAVMNSATIFSAETSFVIDEERASDVAQREELLDQMMGEGRHRKSSEKLRAGRLPAEGLALVARDDFGAVIGTVRLWDVHAGVSTDGHPVDALLLGPLAVSAAHEGQGIGSKLMRAVISAAKQRGHGAILLVGDAAYYQRFGFETEKAAHLVMPGPFERERFQGLELIDGYLEGAAGMLVASGRYSG
jgi:predicted N-acetyltransferase YhbS